MMQQSYWSVTTVVRYVKNILDKELMIQSILVKGEVSNFTRHSSGHFYFTLKDSGARISCVMFSSHAKNCTIQIQNGMQIIASGSISMFEQSGTVQLYVNKLIQDGIGELYQRFEYLKNKLQQEGYFDSNHKKKIPNFPESIALVTGNETAARKDVLTTIERRWPFLRIYEFPTLVQGDKAYLNIIDSLNKADAIKADAILLVRGGGSIEDLWSFNEEEVVKAIYHLNTPIITGVGHEVDVTLADMVSDMRAATPTAAAELITPDQYEIRTKLKQYESYLYQIIQRKINDKKIELSYYKENRFIARPIEYSRQSALQLDLYRNQLETYYKNLESKRHNLNLYVTQFQQLITTYSKEHEKKIAEYKVVLSQMMHVNLMLKKQEFGQSIQLLEAYSPLHVLKRGYSVTYHNESIISTVEDINIDDLIVTKLNQGKIISKVIKKEII